MYLFGFEKCDEMVARLRDGVGVKKIMGIPWPATAGMKERAIREAGEVDEQLDKLVACDRKALNMKNLYEGLREGKEISERFWKTLNKMVFATNSAKRLKRIVNSVGEYNLIPIRKRDLYPKELEPQFSYGSLMCEVDILMRQICLAFFVEVWLAFEIFSDKCIFGFETYSDHSDLELRRRSCDCS